MCFAFVNVVVIGHLSEPIANAPEVLETHSQRTKNVFKLASAYQVDFDLVFDVCKLSEWDETAARVRLHHARTLSLMHNVTKAQAINVLQLSGWDNTLASSRLGSAMKLANKMKMELDFTIFFMQDAQWDYKSALRSSKTNLDQQVESIENRDRMAAPGECLVCCENFNVLNHHVVPFCTKTHCEAFMQICKICVRRMRRYQINICPYCRCDVSLNFKCK